MFLFSMPTILAFFGNLFIFSLTARVLFEGTSIGSEIPFHGNRFSSFASSFNSMFKIMFFEGVMDILVESIAKSQLYFLFFVAFTISTSVIIFGVVAGVFYFYYKMQYYRTLNQLAHDDPNFVSSIKYIMNQKFLKTQHI